MSDTGRMAHLLRQRTVSLLGLLAGCAVLPAAVVHFFGETEVQIPGAVHFLPIGISAGLPRPRRGRADPCGRPRGDARAVLIGTAFSSMAALLSIHGLTTPGFLVGDNGLVAFSGALTLPVGGAVLALSAIPELRRPTAVRPVLALQAALLVAIVASAWRASSSRRSSGRARGGQHPRLHRPRARPGLLRRARRARRAHIPAHAALADLAVVYGLVLLGVALVPAC